jgi:hypothetical protein
MEAKSAKQILLEAAAIIRAGFWTQGCTARTKHGFPTGSVDPGAVSWCALGAVYKVGNQQDAVRAAIHQLRSTIGDTLAIGKWNDSEGQTADNVADALELAAHNLIGDSK